MVAITLMTWSAGFRPDFPGGVSENVGQLVAEDGCQPGAENGCLWTLGTDERFLHGVGDQ